MSSWFGLGLVITCLCPYLVISLKHPGIYWNKTSESFRLDQNDHIINVNLNDEIDILCPFYPTNKSESDMEYYVIYQVPENVYHDCNLRNMHLRKVLNCSTPRVRQRMTLLITQYSAIPNTPDFKPGESYYMITTSTGTKWGMDNPLHGACHKFNMKIKFNVCCGSETKPTENPTSPTTIEPTTTSTKPKPTTEKPGKTEKKKPVKDTDKYGENDVMPKDERRVGDNGTSAVTSSRGLIVVCALVAIRLLSWLHCR